MGLRSWFRKRPSGSDLHEELESHLAMRAEYDGASPSAARNRFGNVLQTQEEMRLVWIAPFWDTLAQDSRFTWRSWRRNPGFALTAILILATGLGASTALFSALDRILFRSLPYPNADRLVSIGVLLPGSPIEVMPDRGYLDLWQPAPPPFESVASVLASGGPCDVTEQQPERLNCGRVEASLLRVLGRNVAVGRDFTAEDDVRGAPRVALIRYDLWIRRFGGDRSAMGRTLNLDGQPVSIVGVLPVDFEMPQGSADVLLPEQLGPIAPAQGSRWFMVVGRLKPNITPKQAEAATRPLMARMLAPTQDGNVRFAFPQLSEDRWRVRSLRDREVGDAPRVAWFLLGAVGVLLLIACVNVTNLLLARVAARQREFSVRAALGAGKSRLARLALTESLLLSLTAGGLGLLIASALLKIFVAMAPASIPKIAQASLDMRVLAVASALAVISGTAIGLWPAISVLRTKDLHGTRTTAAARPRIRFTLVTAQIALTVAMVGGAALLLRSLWNLVSVPLGFDSERVVTLSATLSAARYRTPEQQMAFFEELLSRAKQTPGSFAATLTNAPPPLGMSMAGSNITVEGRPPNVIGQSDRPIPLIRMRSATPGYFETFRIPLTSGRAFSEDDRQSPGPPAILTESAARILFPGQRAIGQRIRTGYPDEPWHEVVGVAKDIRNAGLTVEPQPELYLVRGRTPAEASRFGYLAVRTTADTAVATAFLRQAAADLDPQLPVTIRTVDQQVSGLSERPRFIALLLATFAGFALLLAAAGLYGVASFLVTQRTRDIGVRMALGATPARVVKQVLGEAGSWILGGAVLGLLFAWASSRALESQLYGITMKDSTSWIYTLLVLSVALLFAVMRPAARAARIDPVSALRHE